eukprot:TRINITY_DN15893_c0_g1_i1.p1 TRINITY_DN15893_c0_g1~~TRINITY_DN15893_c0_g1_i1.p1  ORF type:complete len:378 (+),score=41.40 TRINITY_DN15893_c0_g1_i1:184-1317(+)
MKYTAMFPAPEVKNAYCTPRYAGALALYTSGQLVEVVALAFGNSAVLSACSASALVWNAMLANRIFGERFTLLDGVATFGICSGIVCCAVFGPPGHDLNVEEFKHQASRCPFVVFCGFLVLLILICFVFIFYMGVGSKEGETQPNQPGSASGAVIYSVLTASIGSICYFLGSVNSQLIKNDVNHAHPPQMIQVLLISVFLGCCVTNLYFINSALARYEALVYVPVYYVLNILFTVFGCLVFYNDFDDLFPPPYKVICFSLGVLAILVGVRILSLREAGTSTPNPEADREELLSPCNLHLRHSDSGLVGLPEEPHSPNTVRVRVRVRVSVVVCVGASVGVRVRVGVSVGVWRVRVRVRVRVSVRSRTLHSPGRRRRSH